MEKYWLKKYMEIAYKEAVHQAAKDSQNDARQIRHAHYVGMAEAYSHVLNRLDVPKNTIQKWAREQIERADKGE